MLPLTATRICAVIGGTRLFIAVLGFAFFSFLTRVLRLPDPRPTQSRYQILDCNTHLAAGMQDETFSANKQLRSRGQPARRRQQTNSSIDIRLTPIPRPNGISLLISIFPRAQLSNLNDATAERKVNTALAGPRFDCRWRAPERDPRRNNFPGFRVRTKGTAAQAREGLHDYLQDSTRLLNVLVSNYNEPMKVMEESLKSLSFSATRDWSYH
jgi:hypothetical protein